MTVSRLIRSPGRRKFDDRERKMAGLRREVLRLYKQVRGTQLLLIPTLSSDSKPCVHACLINSWTDGPFEPNACNSIKIIPFLDARMTRASGKQIGKGSSQVEPSSILSSDSSEKASVTHAGKLDLLFLISHFLDYVVIIPYFTIQYGQAKEERLHEHEIKARTLGHAHVGVAKPANLVLYHMSANKT